MWRKFSLVPTLQIELLNNYPLDWTFDIHIYEQDVFSGQQNFCFVAQSHITFPTHAQHLHTWNFQLANPYH